MKPQKIKSGWRVRKQVDGVRHSFNFKTLKEAQEAVELINAFGVFAYKQKLAADEFDERTKQEFEMARKPYKWGLHKFWVRKK